MFDLLQSTGTIINPQVTKAIHDLLSSALQLILLLISTVGAWAIRTWIANMKSEWKRKLAFRLAAYAQQKMIDNDEKQNYVASELKKFFPRLSEQEVKNHVEEAVVMLKQGQKPNIEVTAVTTAPAQPAPSSTGTPPPSAMILIALLVASMGLTACAPKVSKLKYDELQSQFAASRMQLQQADAAAEQFRRKWLQSEDHFRAMAPEQRQKYEDLLAAVNAFLEHPHTCAHKDILRKMAAPQSR